MRQASAFEVRHPWLLHNALLLAALLTYCIDREDVVWRFIKASPHARLLEHVSFGAAAVFVALGIWFNARACFHDFNSRRSRRLGGLLYAVGIGTLFPWSGFLLFVTGEFVRIDRYESANSQRTESPQDRPERRKPKHLNPNPAPQLQWKSVLVHQAAAFCAFLSMAIFSVTLMDRQAEYLFAITGLVSALTHFLSPSMGMPCDE
jgi:hypothetical protein